ncbi:uncharacterized protein SCHCODRAFT_02571192 [Schizophyllum commune H4-8]|nr:uncharacterized protein SCHCODRAFT_02571192 [Schizophyllum commune H4-8]KAI5894621.1 hypothetical protein SCHCODRAFT_02571192 [Schizophyllum commune H4-8]
MVFRNTRPSQHGLAPGHHLRQDELLASLACISTSILGRTWACIRLMGCRGRISQGLCATSVIPVAKTTIPPPEPTSSFGAFKSPRAFPSSPSLFLEAASYEVHIAVRLEHDALISGSPAAHRTPSPEKVLAASRPYRSPLAASSWTTRSDMTDRDSRKSRAPSRNECILNVEFGASTAEMASNRRELCGGQSSPHHCDRRCRNSSTTNMLASTDPDNPR